MRTHRFTVLLNPTCRALIGKSLVGDDAEAIGIGVLGLISAQFQCYNAFHRLGKVVI